MRYGSVCSGIEAKACAKCAEAKPLAEFHRQGVGKRHSYCRTCYNAMYRGKARKPVPFAQRRAQNIKARYGITTAELTAMRNRQGGVCAICREPPQREVIDHDHSTGRVRGLLCHPCNIALAHVEDDAFREAALVYLRGHG